MTRTLPLRVAPSPGEALDSWLEALAVRFHLTLGELAGVAAIDYSHTPRWIVELSAPQLRALSRATDTDTTRLSAMTLGHFDGAALAVDHTTGRIATTFPWGAIRRSRYCPRCLADSGGHWQLSWRLTWSFACTVHHCLLVDTCPRCGDHQRTRPLSWAKIPRPGRCTARSPRGDCDGDLRAAEFVALGEAHPALVAQRRVHDVIEQREARFGVFAESPCSAISFLSDIKVLGSRVLAHAKCSGLADAPAQDLVAAYLDQDAPRAASWSSRTYKPRKLPPSTAGEAAVGIAAAMKIVDCESIAGAASAMSWLVPPRGAGQKPAGFAGGLGGSPTLAAINVTAFAAELGPARQLRHRANLTVPGAARSRGSLSPAMMARRLPTMIWPGWAVRMQPRGRHKSALRQSLSCAVLLVATSSTVRQAAELLSGTLDVYTLTGNLGVLRADPGWAAISIAIARLAEDLNERPPPIDYQRRRRLDYRHVVLADDWRAMCERAGMAPRRGLAPEIARIALTAKISGLPPETARADHKSASCHSVMHFVRDLPLHLTPPLREWLEEAGRRFLDAHHIDEPLTWQPPLRLVDGLRLPNSDIECIDVGDLHDLAAHAETSVGAIARTMGTDPDVVRHLLEEHPLDGSRPIALDTETMTAWAKKARLRRSLPKERLAYLHDVEAKSGCAIAKEVGVSYHVLRTLASGYGISFARRPERPTPEWLHEQYVVTGRAQVDIATELHVAPITVAGWIRDDTRSRPTRAFEPTAPPSTAEARILLAPALARRAGRHSLQNFAAALAHPSIAAAADVLEMDKSTLWFQISQLGKDLGGRLLHKARMPSLPMAPTALGTSVAAAVNVLLDQEYLPHDEDLPVDATHAPRR